MKMANDFLLLAGGRISQIVILLVTTRIITSLLSPGQMGRFSIIYTAAALFIALFINGASLYVERRLLEWKLEGTVIRNVGRFVGYLFLSGVAASIFILISQAAIGIDISSLWLIILVFSLVFITNLNGCFASWLNILRKRLWFILTSNLTLVSGLLISIFLVVSFSRTAEYWIGGQILGQVSLIALGGLLFFKVIKASQGERVAPVSHESSMSAVLRFVLPLSMASLVLWLQTQSYRFMLGRLSGLEVLGFFTVGFHLGSRLVERFGVLFSNFYNPIFYEEIAKASPEKKARAWNGYAEAFFPAVILVGLFVSSGGPFIAKIFVAEQFQKIAGSVVFWGSLTALTLSLISTYKMVGVAQLQMKGLIVPYILGTIVALGGILVLSRWNPYIGTGVSLLSGALTTLVYLVARMHRLLPVRFPSRHVAWSVVYSLPVVVLLVILRIIIYDPTLWQSVATLAISGLYLLLAEFLMARDWLFKETRRPLAQKPGKKIRFTGRT